MDNRTDPTFSNPTAQEPTNRMILNGLFQRRIINLEKGDIFSRQVALKSPDFDFGRVEGMMLGLAIGDALGITTEGLLPNQRSRLFGEIRSYIPNKYVDEPIGFPSDDTQLAFWTLDQLNQDAKYLPENVAQRFSREKIFGMGRTVRSFLKNLDYGMEWYLSGPESAGNGALMRIAPILIPHLRSGGSDLWVDTALLAMTTHNDRASTAACLAWIAILWELLEMNTAPPPEFWVDRYVEIAQDLEGETTYRARNPNYPDFQGPIWEFTRAEVTEAISRQIDTVTACNTWYSGAYLLETIPCVLYILSQYAADPQEAIVRAVNDTKDNDTIAAIVGSAVGALHGKEAFPDIWLSNLSGRTTDEDDGKIFRILNTAKKHFWDEARGPE